MGHVCIKESFGVRGLSDDDSTNDLGVTISNVLGEGEFNAGENVICGLEVVELDGTNTLSDGSVSSVLVGDQVLENSGLEGVLPVRVFTNGDGVVVDQRLARVLSGDQVMEYSETVATVGVSVVVTEFSDLGFGGANVDVKGGSHGVLLSIVPVTVSVGATSVVLDDDVVGVSDPESCRGLVSVEKTP